MSASGVPWAVPDDVRDRLRGVAPARAARFAGRDVRIRFRISQGESIDNIASEYGLSPTTIRLIAQGVKRPTRPFPLKNAERDEEIRRRVASGEKRTDVAAAYGLSVARLKQIVRLGRIK